MGFDGQYGLVVSKTPPIDHADGLDMPLDAAIVGAGPAGLFAAETLAAAGHSVAVFDAMPTPARKLLMAGRGGLNLTHAEPLERFLTRYQPLTHALDDAIRAFPPAALVAWANGLGAETFTGSSGRIFPKAMKASPLVRAWLARLDALGVKRRMGFRLQRLTAPDTGLVEFEFKLTDGATRIVTARTALLAMGGASWPRLGSDGSWVAMLAARSVEITPLAASNSGLLIDWSAHLRTRFAGTPLKRIALETAAHRFPGELVVTATGLEGGPAYAAGPHVRRARDAGSGEPVTIAIDLRPDVSTESLTERLSRPRGKQSMATFLRKAASLNPLAIALLREASPDAKIPADAAALARLIKSLPFAVTGTAGLARAISTAGGIRLGELEPDFMLSRLPGVFAAGEMLDWDAPTGGYLLQATFATAAAAARGMTGRLARQVPARTTEPSPAALP